MINVAPLPGSSDFRVDANLVVSIAAWSFSGCVLDGGDQQCGVGAVESGDGVAEADRGACGEAGR
jgi:hypothetical protein